MAKTRANLFISIQTRRSSIRYRCIKKNRKCDMIVNEITIYHQSSNEVDVGNHRQPYDSTNKPPYRLSSYRLPQHVKYESIQLRELTASP